MSNFQIKEKFYLNGQPFQVLSGAIHYFRVVPEYWRDRLEKLKNMGMNTVETYIPWNFHEPKKGQFIWDGMRDFEKFLSIAQELGLYAIVRPSPFICAEWEAGGLPGWLFAEPGMRLRCSYKPYLDHVADYYKVLLPKLVPHQIDNGGNIIMMQIENEYGYFGNDSAYLDFLADLMRKGGITVPFVTSDGPWGAAFKTGQQKDALPTGNFGSSCEKQFGVMKPQMNGEKPLMCMEFWDGWFDAWGNKLKMRSILKMNKTDLEYTVKNGHNINLYMFHGGTNFGFMNGSNYYGKLSPDTTSYDYDAPVSEDGTLTKKYREFQKILHTYTQFEEIPLSTNIQQKYYGPVTWNRTADLFQNLDLLSTAQESLSPLSMEEAGQNTGYILYRKQLFAGEKANNLIFQEANDRLQAFVNGKKLFTAFDKEICNDGHGVWPFTFVEGKIWNIKSEPGAQLDFLVENLGRVNFGHRLEQQKKGITKDVIINGHIHFGWKNYPLPLETQDIEKLCSEGKWTTSEISDNPAFFEFDLDIKEVGDTHLDFKGWGKGCVWVNGFNIGRFWNKGPQKTLYIPAPLLKEGKNKIVVFETEGRRQNTINLVK